MRWALVLAVPQLYEEDDQLWKAIRPFLRVANTIVKRKLFPSVDWAYSNFISKSFVSRCKAKLDCVLVYLSGYYLKLFPLFISSIFSHLFMVCGVIFCDYPWVVCFDITMILIRVLVHQQMFYFIYENELGQRPTNSAVSRHEKHLSH